MKKIFGATLIAVAAIATSASAMDNPAQNSHAKLQKLWGNEQVYASGTKGTSAQVSASRIETDRPTLSTSAHRAKGTSAAARRLQALQPTPAGR